MASACKNGDDDCPKVGLSDNMRRVHFKKKKKKITDMMKMT